MSKKTESKIKNRTISISRRGVLIIALVVALVLALNIITVSYSWFAPETTPNKSLSYLDTAIKTRAEDCNAPLTYPGTKAGAAVGSDGRYSTYKNQIDYSTNSINSLPVQAGTTYYFKTEIVNTNEDYGSDISLYIKNIPACTIAVTYPSNSVRTITEAKDDYYIIRNAYIKNYVSTDVNGPGLLSVEWFITPTTSTTLYLSNMYVVYN